jgi:hypothetical protein
MAVLSLFWGNFLNSKAYAIINISLYPLIHFAPLFLRPLLSEMNFPKNCLDFMEILNIEEHIQQRRRPTLQSFVDFLIDSNYNFNQAGLGRYFNNYTRRKFNCVRIFCSIHGRGGGG